MRTIAAFVLVMLLGFSGGPPRGYVPGASQSEYVRGLLASLQSADVSERVPTAERILKDRRDIIDALIGVAAREQHDAPSGPQTDPKYQAVRLLGELRAEAAVPALLAQLDYTVYMLGGNLYITHGYGPAHPAAEALAKIGKPASEAAMAMLPGTSDRRQARALVWVVTQVEGTDLAKCLISQAKERPAPQSEKDNLSKALALVDEMAGK